jgi:hypothetical protein
MKLSTAMSYSGLSEEAIKKLPCSWRSYFGNSFAVWKCTELDAAKAAAARAAEQALIDKHGAEGLAQMRAKQVAAAAKKQADERRTAAEAAAVRELSSMMAAVQAKRGSAPEPSFDGIVVEQPRRESSLLEKVVPKAKAKQVFGLTEGDLRGMADKGPCGRSKSSFTLDSVLQQSKKCRRGSYNTLPVLYLELQRLKRKHPSLVEAAANDALGKARALADTTRKAADDAEAAFRSLEASLSGSAASTSKDGGTGTAVKNIGDASVMGGSATPAAAARPAKRKSGGANAAAGQDIRRPPTKVAKVAKVAQA